MVLGSTKVFALGQKVSKGIRVGLVGCEGNKVDTMAVATLLECLTISIKVFNVGCPEVGRVYHMFV